MYERAFMDGTLDPFNFVLAEKLGRSVDEMEQTVTNQEWLQWRAFIVWRNAMQELEDKKAVKSGPKVTRKR